MTNATITLVSERPRPARRAVPWALLAPAAGAAATVGLALALPERSGADPVEIVLRAIGLLAILVVLGIAIGASPVFPGARAPAVAAGSALAVTAAVHVLAALARPGILDRLGSISGLVALVALGWLGRAAWQERQRSIERERDRDERDGLTGLLNRIGLERRHRALATDERAGLLMLDLNALQAINDRGGLEAGDAQLRAVARAIEGALPDGAVAARWGLDEFVVLLPGAEAEAERLGEQVTSAAPEPRPGLRGVAAGHALTRGGQPIERALAVAEGRLHHAKAAQREATARATGERVVASLDDFAARLEAMSAPEDVVSAGLTVARDLLGFDATVYIERNADDVFVLQAAEGRLPPQVRALVGKATFRERDGVVGRAIGEARTTWSADYPDDADALPNWIGWGLKTALVAPVREATRVTALVGLMSFSAWRPITPHSRRAVEAVAARLGHIHERLAAVRQVRRTLEGGLLALGLALEGRDLETAGHTRRVVRLAESLGERMGLRGPGLEALKQGAYLHDIGKLSVPDAVLLKPGRFDPAEWELMQTHATRGFELALNIPTLPEGALEVIRHHHERWDGRGYPDGLAGDAIPLRARIFAVCDVYDALVSERPYKHAWTHLQAVEELRAKSGTQFDPTVVKVFVEIVLRDADVEVLR